MKSLKFLSLVCLFCIQNISAFADDPFEVDGVWYQILFDSWQDPDNKYAQVCHPPYNIENPYQYYSGVINIAESVEQDGVTYPVRKIQNSAFRGQTEVTTVVFPKSLQTIDYRAFWGCKPLRSIVFRTPSNLQNIEREAFYGCSNLTSITIPNSVTYIGEDVFHGCTGLKNVKGGESIEILDNNAFQGCISLTEITIPKSVKTIGDYAFWECSALKTVIMNEGLEVIGNDAFLQCKVLENVTIPNTVKEIGWEAFRWCINLTSIEIPNSVEKMGYGVFRYCTWLRDVKLGDSLKEIPAYAFEQTPITSIKIPNSVTSILGYAFRECVYLQEIEWGNSLESISGEAFAETGFTRLVLPEPLKRIYQDAFCKCENLTEVTIPRTVNQIMDGAFQVCKNLKTVYNLATIPQDIPYTSCPFVKCDYPVEVHVYEGLKELYEKNIGWEQAIASNWVRIIDDIPLVKATSVTINDAPYFIEVGGVGQATATIYPENVASNELSWSSSDESVLYIEEFTGQYVGLSDGSVTITATATDGSGVKGSASVFVGQTDDGISPIRSFKQSDIIYNLKGQQLHKAAKGVNIVNGKKVIF